MRSFKDHKENTWDVHLTMGKVELIESRLKIDLLNMGDEKFLLPLFEDDRMLVALFWSLCEDQAKDKSIDEKGFGHLFDGPTLELCATILMEELVNFFRGSKKEMTATLLAKTESLLSQKYKSAEERIAGLSLEEIEKQQGNLA